VFAKVCIDAVIGSGNSEFDYLIPEGLRVEVGARVLVPFGRATTEGFVLGLSGTSDVPEDRLKAIVRVMVEFVAVKPEFLAIL